MPIWFNIPEPLYLRLTHGVTEKVKIATCRIVVEARRFTGSKTPDKTERRQDPEATAEGDYLILCFREKLPG